MSAVAFMSLYVVVVILAFSSFHQVFKNLGRIPLGQVSAVTQYAIRFGSTGIALGVAGSVVAILWEYQTTTFDRFIMIVVVGYVIGIAGFYLGLLVFEVIESYILVPFAKLIYRVIRQG